MIMYSTSFKSPKQYTFANDLINSIAALLWYVILVQTNPTQPVKLDLNKKSLPKQKTIQNFTIDAQGFRKTKNENPPTWEMGFTSEPVLADLPTWSFE